MSAEAVTKTCSTCFSEIDARARKCPACHALQGRLKCFLVTGATLTMTVVVGSVIWFDIVVHQRLQSKGPNLANNIEVVASRQFFVPKEENHQVSVVGLLKNTGKEPVNRITLELRLTDRDGSLIDASTRTVTGDLQPGDEVSFKVSGYQSIHLPQADYAQHQVIVRSARHR